MKQRCVSCRCIIATDHTATRCSPCVEAYDDAVGGLARWLKRFMRSDLSAVEYAEALVSSISTGGTDGYEARERLLRAVLAGRHPRRGTLRSRPIVPPSPTRPAPRTPRARSDDRGTGS